MAVIQPMPYKLKASCQCPITSAFPWCRFRRPWAACPTTARAGGSKRTCFPWRCPKARMRPIVIYPTFSKKFNIKSDLFVHQWPTLSQKIDSRGGLFWCKKGGSCACRQNEFLFKLTATNTRFWVICSKMQCVLVQNTVQYAAKRSAFWC